MSGPPADNTPAFLSSRAMPLLLACAFGAAMIGFFVGVGRRPMPQEIGLGPIGVHRNRGGSVLPASSYIELRDHVLSPNRTWATRIETLVQHTPGLHDPVMLDPSEKQDSLSFRATRRAYNGAPPVIPHSIDQLSSEACVVCHEGGLRVEGRIASTIPHQYMVNCTQCHVEQTSSVHEPSVIAANLFQGKEAPTRGDRAWAGAPPVIPHTTLMRGNCLACHGVNGAAGMRSTHPWRQSCTQCHAPSSALNQQNLQEDDRR